jgi:hypothetical protein
LKGALLLTAWRGPLSRPTTDIDLAGKTSNDLAHIESVIKDVCIVVTPPDGLDFKTASIELARIKEDAEYEGIRVRFNAALARARISMQIDIGFGDVIVPEPSEVQYPTLLEFPPPVLSGYPKETVVAEKLEAITALRLLNSRIKDYYDLTLLSRVFTFEGQLLVTAIRATFRHRGTPIEPDTVGLSDAFSSHPARGAQWRAFLRRSRFSKEPGGLPALVSEVRRFSAEVLAAAVTGEPFRGTWSPGGPWRSQHQTEQEH